MGNVLLSNLVDSQDFLPHDEIRRGLEQAKHEYEIVLSSPPLLKENVTEEMIQEQLSYVTNKRTAPVPDSSPHKHASGLNKAHNCNHALHIASNDYITVVVHNPRRRKKKLNQSVISKYHNHHSNKSKSHKRKKCC